MAITWLETPLTHDGEHYVTLGIYPEVISSTPTTVTYTIYLYLATKGYTIENNSVTLEGSFGDIVYPFRTLPDLVNVIEKKSTTPSGFDYSECFTYIDNQVIQKEDHEKEVEIYFNIGNVSLPNSLVIPETNMPMDIGMSMYVSIPAIGLQIPIKVSGSWKVGNGFVKVNGSWKQGCRKYIKSNG